MIDADDIMNAAPLPYGTTEVGAERQGFHIYLTDATGRKIAAIWGPPAQKAFTASLLASAVNALHRPGLDNDRLQACLGFLDASAEQNRQVQNFVREAGASAQLLEDAANAIRELIVLREHRGAA